MGLLTSWCCLGIPLGIAAIITGVMGRNEAKRRGMSPTMATIGLALGILSLVIFLIFILIGALSTDFNFDTDSDFND